MWESQNYMFQQKTKVIETFKSSFLPYIQKSIYGELPILDSSWHCQGKLKPPKSLFSNKMLELVDLLQVPRKIYDQKCQNLQDFLLNKVTKSFVQTFLNAHGHRRSGLTILRRFAIEQLVTVTKFNEIRKFATCSKTVKIFNTINSINEGRVSSKV